VSHPFRPPDFPALTELVHAIHEQKEVSVGGLWGSSQAFVLAALTERAHGPFVVVVSSDAEAEAFVADLAVFGVEAVHLPPRMDGEQSDHDALRLRLQVGQQLAGPPQRRPRVLVASILALLEPLPSPRALSESTLTLQRRQGLNVEELLERLVRTGYSRVPLVEEPGEISLRGDILDIYPFAADRPVRIELFDEEIDSIRSFDPSDQRSVESFPRLELVLARDAGGVEDGDGVAPLALMPPSSSLVRIEPLRIADVAEGLRIRSSSHQRALMQLDERTGELRRIELQSLPGRTINFDTRSVQSLAGPVNDAPDRLRALARAGASVLVLCPGEAEEKRLAGRLSHHDGHDGPDGPDGDGGHGGDDGGSDPGPGTVQVAVGSLSRGFQLPVLNLVVLGQRELFGIDARPIRPRKPSHRARALQSFFELKPGDLVVHAIHGLARFEELKLLRRGAGEEEHLQLVFADDVRLFVPACRIDLVQRYIGAGSSPTLDRIGGGAFRKRKQRVERALEDLAADLLEIHAKRELNRRDPWPNDAELEAEFASAFPYEDTVDQEKVDAEVRADLSAPQPMDRLLCGDVGFGKTELAVRAAFRVAAGGGQVAVLVPTTVLADQHARTFQRRMAGFPVEVAALSRYVSSAQARSVLDRVERGEVDVLIGTHRILSKDVRFKRLGLVIIDEEQRFGVAHKEHFKALRAGVDVLALSATPIPRTLHMSLSGVRDISALTVAPPGRQDIVTRLGYVQDDQTIRAALALEKDRGGQVFALHNRVGSIDKLARRLQHLAPDCRFAIGHGQMRAHQLQRAMSAFTRGDVDCLVATSIVENGIDIPSAGTILIFDADLFGLSELHQLRGRVGRGSVQAYCYLLVDQDAPLSQVARNRLKALEEMSQLGSGFSISMKDLELRGAGNILGPEQSGNLAAVGYDMYCRLLHATIERLRHQEGEPTSALGLDSARAEEQGLELELGLRAFLPEAFIPSAEDRIEILRELDSARSEGELADAAAALRDRFGRLPPEAEALVATFALRSRLEPLGIRRLTYDGDAYVVEYADRLALERWVQSGAELRPLREGKARLVVPETCTGPAEALKWLESLQGA
jgi:transcription-repair coupling factor (superfamily II helicase)